jgi:hypothetical protein
MQMVVGVRNVLAQGLCEDWGDYPDSGVLLRKI